MLADPEDTTSISILAVNRSEREIECHQELCDLQTLYPERVRVAFSLTADPSEVAPSCHSNTMSLIVGLIMIDLTYSTL